MKRCLLLWVLLESMPAGAPAAVVPDAKAATNYYVLSSAAAQTNLVKLRRMANPVTYKQLGFSATNEPAAASNGVPLLVYEATLARLREYKNEPDYANLVEPTVRIIYPVLIGGEARCSHTLRLMADGSASTAMSRL